MNAPLPGQGFAPPPVPPPPPPTLNSVQRDLYVAAMARLNTALEMPSLDPADPPAAPLPPPNNIRALVDSGTLTIPELERFLNENCRWYYTGGYAAQVWARHDRLPVVATRDLDIFVERGKLKQIRFQMFGPDNELSSTSADGYKVTLFEADDGIFANCVRVEGVLLIRRKELTGRYNLHAEIQALRKDKEKADPDQEAKLVRRQQRLGNLTEGDRREQAAATRPADEEKETEHDKNREKDGEPDRDSH